MQFEECNAMQCNALRFSLFSVQFSMIILILLFIWISLLATMYYTNKKYTLCNMPFQHPSYIPSSTNSNFDLHFLLMEKVNPFLTLQKRLVL